MRPQRVMLGEHSYIEFAADFSCGYSSSETSYASSNNDYVVSVSFHGLHLLFIED
jgi:hypothetical protein